MADDNGIAVDQDLLNQQPRNFLLFRHVKRIRSSVQLGAKVGQRLGHTQVARLIGRRQCKRLQFSLDCLLLFAQRRHALTQMVQAQQFFLIGRQQPFDVILQPHLLLAQTLLAATERVGTSCCG
jgi:hypothetical protein